jgi:hypothetical protein
MTILSCFLNCEGQYIKWTCFQLDVGCPVVIAAAIPDAMLLPTDECFAQEVPEPAYDGLTCPKYALWDSSQGSWLAKEQKPPVQNIRQLEATLHREWQQLSQQDIRRLTGEMRRRVEAVIQTRGG